MKSLFVVIISLIMCSFIYSQEDTTCAKYALSFGIGNNFTLRNFDMDIAVKKIIDQTHQLRLFLSPSLSNTNQENETTGSLSGSDNKSLRYSLGIGADYLWILLKNEDIHMFGGTGLEFSYGNVHEKVTSTSNMGDKSTNERNSPFINIGLRGILGVEWMVSKKIGIHSEYLLTGSYYWDKTEIKNSLNGIDNPTTKSTSWSIMLNTGVLFGLSIYL